MAKTWPRPVNTAPVMWPLMDGKEGKFAFGEGEADDVASQMQIVNGINMSRIRAQLVQALDKAARGSSVAELSVLPAFAAI